MILVGTKRGLIELGLEEWVVFRKLGRKKDKGISRRRKVNVWQGPDSSCRDLGLKEGDPSQVGWKSLAPGTYASVR